MFIRWIRRGRRARLLDRPANEPGKIASETSEHWESELPRRRPRPGRRLHRITLHHRSPRHGRTPVRLGWTSHAWTGASVSLLQGGSITARRQERSRRRRLETLPGYPRILRYRRRLDPWRRFWGGWRLGRYVAILATQRRPANSRRRTAA